MGRGASLRPKGRFRARRLFALVSFLTVFFVVITCFAADASRSTHAGAALIDPLPLPPLPLPTLPPDTTPTTPPDTTPPDTTPTTVPPTTTPTTRPRPTTTTTSRPAKKPRLPGASGSASGSPTSGTNSFNQATPSGSSPARRARAAARRATAAALPSGTVAPLFPSVPALPSADTGPSVLGLTKTRRHVAEAPKAFTPQETGTNRLAWAIGFGVLLAGATGLGLVLRKREGRGKRAPRLGALVGQPLVVGRSDTESGLRDRLTASLAHGPVNVSGSDARSLQMLVKVAAYAGLEIRDPRGFVGAAASRLVEAYDSAPDRKKIALRWTVIVSAPTVEVPADRPYVVQPTGPAGEGRRLSFARGSTVLLWDGELV